MTTLAPGESYTQDAAFTVPAADSGDYYLLFVADSGGDQAESDESDNVRAVPINLVGSSSKLPDLIVTAATAPSTAVIGDFDVSSTCRTRTSRCLRLLVESFYLSTNATYDPSDTFATGYYHSISLAAGASQSFNTTINLPSVPAGSYYLLVVADGSNYVSESDETNNVRAVPIALHVQAVDLIVTAADAPATAKAGGSATVSWTVKNQGTDAAVASWSDAVYLSTDDKYDAFDTYVTSSYVFNPTPLDPGASYSRNPTITLPSVPAGSYYMLFVADSSHSQAETVETNNVRTIPITLTPLDVNLEVTAATAPVSAKPGPVDISWTVTNQGDPITGYWTDYVYLSKDQTYDFSDSYVTSGSHYGTEPLGPGESDTIAQTANLPGLAPGDYYLLFLADLYNNVSETNETNNTRAVPITLTGLECGPGRDRGRRPRDRHGRRDGRHLLDGRAWAPTPPRRAGPMPCISRPTRRTTSPTRTWPSGSCTARWPRARATCTTRRSRSPRSRPASITCSSSPTSAAARPRRTRPIISARCRSPSRPPTRRAPSTSRSRTPPHRLRLARPVCLDELGRDERRLGRSGRELDGCRLPLDRRDARHGDRHAAGHHLDRLAEPAADGRGYIVSMDVFLPPGTAAGISPCSSWRTPARTGPSPAREQRREPRLHHGGDRRRRPRPCPRSRSTTARPNGRWSRT